MAERLRLGFVGTGWISELHLPALERLGRTILVGVVSRAADRAAAMTARWGGAAYTDLGAMVADARPDVVYVCQPPNRAAEACMLLVEHGLPFLTEKPLAAAGPDAERVGEAIRQAGEVGGRPLVAAVGYQWRGLDFLPLVRERLAAHPARLVIARWTGGMPPPPWWRRVDESGGQVVEQATHLYDLARALIGEGRVVAAASSRAPRPEAPEADVDDLAVALVRFGSGAVGSFASASILASAQVEFDLLADGSRTTIRLLQDGTGLHWSLTIDDGGQEATMSNVRDPYEVQAAAFLDAVEAADPRLVLSSYADALKTDRLARSVVAATGSRG